MAYQDGPGGRRVEPRFDSPLSRDPADEPADRPAPEKSSGRRGRLLGALVALVAVGGFTGIAWYATTQGQRDSSAVVPVIRADENPVKVLPEKPGGMEVPNQDKLIYMQIDPNAKEPEVERLLPPPEAPMDKPPPAAAAEAPPAGPLVPEAPEVGREPIAPRPGAPAEILKAEPDGERMAEPSAAEPGPAPKEPEVAALPEAPEAALGNQDREAMAAAAAAAAVVPGGGYLVQLGALRDKASADEEAARLSRAHSEILGTLTVATVAADLGERGTFYRLRAGPLADREAAEAMCKAFAERKVGCLVIAP